MADDARIASAVIIDPAFLGDVVFDAPLVRALLDRNPACRIGIVVRPPADAIARAMPGVARVHIFDKRRRDRGWSGLRRVARELEEARYDLALIPHPSVRSTLLAYLAKIPDRRGTASGLFARSFLTQSMREIPSDTFVGSRLRLIGSPDLALAHALMSPASPSPSPKKRVGLVLGSQWPTKRWAPDRATEFVRALDPAIHELVLLGAEDERALFATLGPLPHAIDRIGGTVDELLAAIASCDLLVAGDTGPLHIARAFGIPTIALFGPTSEAKHAFTSRDRVLAVAGLSCRPCSAHGDATCPEGHHRCMRELSASSVLVATHELLGGAR